MCCSVICSFGSLAKFLFYLFIFLFSIRQVEICAAYLSITCWLVFKWHYSTYCLSWNIFSPADVEFAVKFFVNFWHQQTLYGQSVYPWLMPNEAKEWGFIMVQSALLVILWLSSSLCSRDVLIRHWAISSRPLANWLSIVVHRYKVNWLLNA